MATRPLAAVEKVAVLEALVAAGYSVRVAARRLKLSPGTIYRKLRRWGLASPMFSTRVGEKVLRKDFAERCRAIQRALGEADAQIRGGTSEQEQQGTSELLRPEPRIDGGTQQR